MKNSSSNYLYLMWFDIAKGDQIFLHREAKAGGEGEGVASNSSKVKHNILGHNRVPLMQIVDNCLPEWYYVSHNIVRSNGCARIRKALRSSWRNLNLTAPI